VQTKLGAIQTVAHGVALHQSLNTTTMLVNTVYSLLYRTELAFYFSDLQFHPWQGDQIGRIFASWGLLTLGFLKNYQVN
jgi:hypothetical protein